MMESSSLMPLLGEVDKSNPPLLDEKFNTVLQSQQDFLRRFGGGEPQDTSNIEDSMKAEYGEDNRLLDQEVSLKDAGIDSTLFNGNDCKTNKSNHELPEDFDVEFKASSFFSDDEDDDELEFDDCGLLLDRPSKRPRVVSPLKSDIKALEEERRTISRSVLDQIASNDSSGSLHNLTSLPYPTESTSNSTFSNMKAQMRRVSLDYLNQSLLREDRESMMSNEFEPLGMFKNHQPVAIGTHVVSLSSAITKSQQSQKDIQDWDRKMGLKRSHSRTMSLSSKSRRQVLELLAAKGGHM